MTVRAVLIAMLLSTVAVVWQHQASVAEGGGNIYALAVPPVPALFGMIFLAGLAAITARLSRRALTRKELIVAYVFLVLTVPQTTFGVVELLIPWMTTHVYFATPQNELARLGPELPGWYYPHDEEAIRQMYEGNETGVPWRVWLYPLAMWTAVMALVFFTGLCLVNLFRRQWTERERLRFPLLLIPVSLVEKEAPGSHTAFFRNPLVWIAIVLVFTHHSLNVARTFNPSVPALMDYYRIGAIFTEAPWTEFYGVRLFYRPQVLGLAYFVSPDLLFTTWVSFLSQPVVAIIADLLGRHGTSDFPYSYQQGAGSYFAMIFVLLWVGRHQLGEIARRAARGARAEEGERLSPGFWLFGALAGFAALVIWGCAARFSPLLSIPYFFLLLGFGLVYARVRAEGGVPAMWAFPFNQHKELMFNLLGTRGFMTGGSAANLVMLSAFSWMGRGYYMSQMGYQVENEALADRYGIRSRWFVALTMGAFLFGCLVAYYVTLRDNYAYGAISLGGGTTSGGSNVWNARTQWEEVIGAMNHPGAPDVSRTLAAGVGALLTVGMVLLRSTWLQSPFHPLGYAISLNYGYALWSNFLLAWAIKAVVHRLGGARLYRQLMPLFLGLVVGDLLAGGLSWLALALLGRQALGGYVVQFG